MCTAPAAAGFHCQNNAHCNIVLAHTLANWQPTDF